jgi:hypothetical protein
MIKVTILQQEMACLVGTDGTNSSILVYSMLGTGHWAGVRRPEGEKLVLRKDVQMFRCSDIQQHSFLIDERWTG